MFVLLNLTRSLPEMPSGSLRSMSVESKTRPIDLSKLPDLLGLPPDSKSELPKMTAVYRNAAKDLMGLSFDQLKNEISDIFKAANVQESRNPYNMAKVFVLFRFIYEIPDSSTYEAGCFVGFTGENRRIPGGISVSWPVVNEKVGASIKYEIAGFNGEPYHAVEELKYLNAHFKRRQYR